MGIYLISNYKKGKSNVYLVEIKNGKKNGKLKKKFTRRKRMRRTWENNG